ncbi:DUF6101 family protein [Bartonella raoultii]|uniref:Uncharacterized protein n=1 Tax=Bartonella raoultii TaxID=1457020 RepID=A0ABS7I913_9HYPH|nr:DUF6101 family protein [Bartonella raoultii]MBX4336147.1 hypothetical protein [Bartonella raoultii]
MANQCFNQAKAVLEFRLDPYHLPQTITYYSSKTGNKIICSLNERGVFFKTEFPASISHLMPSYHFKGIAARAVKTCSGERAVALELFHADKEACIPLLVSRDLNNVLLDWRLWADIYGLPMLMINEDNRIVVVKDRANLRRLFCKTLHSKQKRFLLRYRNPLGLRLMIANEIALQ